MAFLVMIFFTNHSQNKKKDRPEGSLNRVLFETKFEFLKILVRRYPKIHQM